MSHSKTAIPATTSTETALAARIDRPNRATLAQRTFSPTSTIAFIALCFMVAGLLHDLGFSLPRAEASSTTETASHPTPSIAINQPTAAATAIGSRLSCSCECEPVHGVASSGAMSRLALPSLWLVCIAFVACCLVLCGGQFHETAGTSPEMVQSVDGDGGETLSPAVGEASGAEASHTIVHRPVAGRLLPEKIKIKRSEPAVEREHGGSTTDVQVKQPGPVKPAVLVALLLLTAMLVPMALAEPTSTSMSATSMTLPSPSPCTTTFDAVGSAVGGNQTLDLQEKDRPQTWFYNSSDRTSTHLLLSLIPVMLMSFFLLPPFAAAAQEKNNNAVEGTGSGSETAPLNESPVWEIHYSTTTVWPPTVTITTPKDARPKSSGASISVAGSGRGSSGLDTVCTEADPAVCPIVLGRKPWRPM